jgi:hypothetical protein
MWKVIAAGGSVAGLASLLFIVAFALFATGKDTPGRVEMDDADAAVEERIVRRLDRIDDKLEERIVRRLERIEDKLNVVLEEDE